MTCIIELKPLSLETSIKSFKTDGKPGWFVHSKNGLFICMKWMEKIAIVFTAADKKAGANRRPLTIIITYSRTRNI